MDDTSVEFSRRIAKVLNSRYFYGKDSSPDRLQDLMRLREESQKVDSFDELPRMMQGLVEDAEKTFEDKS